MSSIQYTIRNVPSAVDSLIRKRAQQEGTSFNQTVLDILNLQLFGSTKPVEDTQFDWLFKQNTLDSTFDTAVQELSQVDTALWQ